MITDDAELEAAQKAQTVLITLSPSTPSSEAVVSQMRNTAQLAAKAAEHNFSSEAELNNVRAEAGLALIGVIGALQDGSLTEGALYRGRDAVRRLDRQARRALTATLSILTACAAAPGSLAMLAAKRAHEGNYVLKLRQSKHSTLFSSRSSSASIQALPDVPLSSVVRLAEPAGSEF